MKRSSVAATLCLALLGLAGYAATQSYLHGQATGLARAPKELTSYRDVVKHALPAVVSIEAVPKTTTAPAAARSLPFDELPGLPPELRKRFEQFRQPPSPTPGRAIGSGFLVDPKGVILTNDHVVRDAEQVVVQLQDGRKFVARDVRRDPQTDLAIVRIEAKESLPFLELGDSDATEIGDRVLALGAPLGLRGTVTAGIVSAKGRDIHMNRYEDFLQTDAAINPGNSGGPLVDLNGKVIGINSAIKSGTGGFQGIGLAVSSNLARNVLQQLLQDGTVHRGYLGVLFEPLDPEVADRLGVSDRHGVLVARVLKDTPAARAGLRAGDVLTAVAGRPVKDARDLQGVVAGLPAGKPVDVTVLRDGTTKTLRVTVEEQPRDLRAATGSEQSAPHGGADSTRLEQFGLEMADLTPERAGRFGYPSGARGVVTTDVAPNGVAAGAGLSRGQRIVKVDGQEVPTAHDAQAAFGKGSLEKGVLLQVQDPTGAVRYVLLKASPTK
jgi:serine protease Do